MRVIPVIDLLRGCVVRGIAGRRSEYRPLVSRLCAQSSPLDVARGLAAEFGFRDVYVADLDAIGGASPDMDSYRAIASAGYSLWVDPGIRTPFDAVLDDLSARRTWAGATPCGSDFDQPASIDRIVVGLETVGDLNSLPEFVGAIGAERAVFSLDMKEGTPLSDRPEIRTLAPLEIAARAIDSGFTRLIILDLSGVGTGDGVRSLELCRRLRRQFPSVELTTGGGVRHIDDLLAMADAGCNAALVASALHDGRLTRRDIERV